MEQKFAKISESLTEDLVDCQADTFLDKNELFSNMAQMLLQAGRIMEKDAFLQALYQREDTGSTYMGNGIALPHGKSDTVTEPTVAFCRCKNAFPYESDGETGEVDLIFMLAIPKATETNEYLRVLANLSRLLVHEDFVASLRKAPDFFALKSAVQQYEQKLDSKSS